MDEYQPLKTSGSLGLFLLIAAILVLTGGMISQNLGDPDVGLAQHSAKSLALQLSSGGLPSIDTKQSEPGSESVNRGLASDQQPHMHSLQLFGKVGRISKDPWGNSFHYNFVEDKNGQPKAIVVWSNGPNHKKETKGQSFEKLLFQKAKKIHFFGDDLGYVLML